MFSLLFLKSYIYTYKHAEQRKYDGNIFTIWLFREKNFLPLGKLRRRVGQWPAPGLRAGRSMLLSGDSGRMRVRAEFTGHSRGLPSHCSTEPPGPCPRGATREGSCELRQPGHLTAHEKPMWAGPPVASPATGAVGTVSRALAGCGRRELRAGNKVVAVHSGSGPGVALGRLGDASCLLAP